MTSTYQTYRRKVTVTVWKRNKYGIRVPNDTVVTVNVEIDWDALFNVLAETAFKNKTKHARGMGGLIRATIPKPDAPSPDAVGIATTNAVDDPHGKVSPFDIYKS